MFGNQTIVSRNISREWGIPLSYKTDSQKFKGY